MNPTWYSSVKKTIINDHPLEYIVSPVKAKHRAADKGSTWGMWSPKQPHEGAVRQTAEVSLSVIMA